MTSSPQSPLVLPDAAAWRAWLDEHEDTVPDGVWLVVARKGRPDAPTTLLRPDALDEALCSGWIDAQALGRDADSSLQRYCPRRPRSIWSVRNQEFVARLTREGRMRPRGQAEIDRAKADGRWEAAYAGPATIEVPEELTVALAASPRATTAWGNLTSQNRYAILHRLVTLKRPESRVRNAEKFTAMLEQGRTFHPQKRDLGLP
ncbi:YdeI/OmpD-associated family protein [Isoptericola jiangsuensis]|uniref:YdeI/OmpD-associated family protein n=1 Tax=Isoptericola jiangsuensis TaxID=548579 RepID=UPI003AAA6048